MKKKIIAFIAAALTIMLMLAACTDDNTKATATPSASATPQASETASAQPSSTVMPELVPSSSASATKGTQDDAKQSVNPAKSADAQTQTSKKAN